MSLSILSSLTSLTSLTSLKPLIKLCNSNRHLYDNASPAEKKLMEVAMLYLITLGIHFIQRYDEITKLYNSDKKKYKYIYFKIIYVYFYIFMFFMITHIHSYETENSKLVKIRKFRHYLKNKKLRKKSNNI